MNYYKVTNGSDFIGVGATYDLRKYQLKHRILIACEENDVQYIQIKNDLYHDDWMRPVITDQYPYSLARVTEISEAEYNALYTAVQTDQEIVEPGYSTQPEEEVPPEDDNLLAYVKEMKIKEMSKQCEDTIVSGVTIGDKHFSFEFTDQLMIQALAMKARVGVESLPWHADGEMCAYYSADEILTIYGEMEKIISYQTTYFNSLRGYINSLESVEAVGEVFYGQEIPDEYKSEVLKDLEGDAK